MEKCIHEEVCRYKTEEAGQRCGNTEICKHCDDGSCGVVVKKHHKAGVWHPKAHKAHKAEDPNDDEGTGEEGISEKEFKRAKKQVEYFMKSGKLTDNQQLALDTIKGKHFKNLPEVQRKQMLDIAKDVMKAKE